MNEGVKYEWMKEWKGLQLKIEKKLVQEFVQSDHGSFFFQFNNIAASSKKTVH